MLRVIDDRYSLPKPNIEEPGKTYPQRHAILKLLSTGWCTQPLPTQKQWSVPGRMRSVVQPHLEISFTEQYILTSRTHERGMTLQRT